MKQIIIITGNVASGKTSLAKALAADLQDFTYVCLDAARLLHHDSLGDAEKENEAAASDVVSDLIRCDLIIFENSGSTRFFTRMMEIIKARKMQQIHIHLDADPDVCIQRSRDRKKYQFQVPPVHGKLSLEGFIHKCHRDGIQETPDLIIQAGQMPADQVHHVALNHISNGQGNI